MQSRKRTAADGISIDDGKADTEAQASTTESIQNCTTFDCQEQERIDGRLPIGAREAAGCFLPNAEKLVGGIYDAIIIKGDTIDLSDALINRLRFNGLTWAEMPSVCSCGMLSVRNSGRNIVGQTGE